MTGAAGLRVAVAGGTGVVGRHVVAALTAAGHDPVVLARSTGVDVTTGDGVAAALEGVHAVVDASNVMTLRRSAAVAFFEAATRTLLHVGAAAGVQHHVVLSIVGIDDVKTGYYQGKQRQEQVALAGEVPCTVLRATQFHEFAEQVLARAIGPIRPVPRMRMQPVAAAEVGAALAEIAVGPAVGRAPDLGGPEVHELPDLARRVLEARGLSGRVVAVRAPGGAGRQLAGGGLLTREGARRGTTTFDQWLAGSA